MYRWQGNIDRGWVKAGQVQVATCGVSDLENNLNHAMSGCQWQQLEPTSEDEQGYVHYCLWRELIILAQGVSTYDHVNHQYFLLRAFLILIIGDMLAIAHIMDMKGHIGKSPCRACWVTGKRDRTNDISKIHYPVHTDSNHQVQHNIQDLLNNPHTHQSFYNLANWIVKAETLARADAQWTCAGLNLMSVLWGLPGTSLSTHYDVPDLLTRYQLRTFISTQYHAPNILKCMSQPRGMVDWDL